jgi:protoheme IX farnesyltransferase
MLISLAEMWAFVNPLAAVLALTGGLFYVVVYTVLLKRTTPQNIVIGGAAGAIPPLVGCAAVSGSLSVQAWTLFAIVFLWTPPHFWALALLIREDYARANVPMLPVVAGERETVRQVNIYAWVLVAASLVPVAFGVFGVVYLLAAATLGARLLWHCRRLAHAARTMQGPGPLVKPASAGHAAARGTFLFSMAYLALLFLAAVLDQTALHVRL